MPSPSLSDWSGLKTLGQLSFESTISSPSISLWSGPQPFASTLNAISCSKLLEKEDGRERVLLISNVCGLEKLLFCSGISVGRVSGHWSISSVTPSLSLSNWYNAHPFSSTVNPSLVIGHSSITLLMPSLSESEYKIKLPLLKALISFTLKLKTRLFVSTEISFGMKLAV